MQYLVELYAPRSAIGHLPELGERLGRAAAEVARGGRAVAYLWAIVVPEDETCYLLYDAESADAVAAAAHGGAVAFERIVEATSAEAAPVQTMGISP